MLAVLPKFAVVAAAAETPDRDNANWMKYSWQQVSGWAALLWSSGGDGGGGADGYLLVRRRSAKP